MTFGPNKSAGPAQASSAQPVSAGDKSQPRPINVVISQPSSADSSAIFGPSSPSPIHTRSHPFLRKLQSAINSVPQQTPSATGAIGTSAFSTSTCSSSKDPSDGGRKSVDEAIAAVSSRKVGDVSPTIVAANATDAIFTRRLSNMSDSSDEGHHHEHHDGCCSRNSTEVEYYDTKSPQLEPISDEARRFTEKLLGQNKAWAKKTEEERPGFFAKLEEQQKPQVLWIGCSDSRVPANQIVNLDPGEIFVHRNIANVVTHTDMNLLSVLEYAVDVLKVRHIIICGHYGCGGVAASLTQKEFGIIDNWLRNIKDLYTIHRKKFDALPQGSKEQHDLLTELNVIQSALNVCHTSIIQKAWSRGAELSVHGWCYRLSDGVIRNLGLCIEGPEAEEVVAGNIPDNISSNSYNPGHDDQSSWSSTNLVVLSRRNYIPDPKISPWKPVALPVHPTTLHADRGPDTGKVRAKSKKKLNKTKMDPIAVKSASGLKGNLPGNNTSTSGSTGSGTNNSDTEGQKELTTNPRVESAVSDGLPAGGLLLLESDSNQF
ncbi:hypothetical protein BGX26_007858 [Mortierella sp. AD094]|nr:hypothetical protein BGX26_007858 [Mortierella sp. AD094]